MLLELADFRSGSDGLETSHVHAFLKSFIEVLPANRAGLGEFLMQLIGHGPDRGAVVGEVLDSVLINDVVDLKLEGGPAVDKLNGVLQYLSLDYILLRDTWSVSPATLAFIV